MVLDIDGTIAGPDFTVSDRVRKAIAQAQDAGATVVLATGRILPSARRIAIELRTNGPLVCYQGAVIADPVTGDLLRHERLDPEAALEALGEIQRSGAHVNVHVDGEIYVKSVSDWAAGYASRMRLELQVVDALEPLAARRPTLILAVNEPLATKALAARLRTLLGGRALVTHSIPTFCEVASPRAGKVAALQVVADGLGIPASEAVAFGDGAGDAGMLAWAGLGVAVGAAHPEVLAAAGRTAPGPERDGVARLLEEWVRDGVLGG